MAKVKIKVSSGLQTKLNKMVLETKKQLAKDAQNELVGAAHDAMEKFYSHYTPKRYKRTFGFRDKSYVGSYKNPHNSRIYGGVRITTENINANDYKTYELTTDGDKKKWIPISVEPTDALSGNGIPKTMGDIRELVYTGHHGYTDLFNQMWEGKRNFEEPPVMKPSPYEIIEAKRDEYIDKIKSEGRINKTAIKFWK